MKQKIYLYISLLLLTVLGACQEETFTSTAPDLKADEYRFTMALPEPVSVTRAMGDKAAFTRMNVLVFNDQGVFVARREATAVSVSTDTNPQEVTFTVELAQSETPRILHFVGGDVTFGTYSVGDTEASIFNDLTVSGNTDAYWQRVEVSEIVNTDEGKQALMNEINGMYLIRNFAKIDVTTGLDDSQFAIEGFTVVNNTTEGTVAPYAGVIGRRNPFADFNIDDDVADPYTAFTALNDGYAGNLRGSLNSVVPEDDMFSKLPVYVYERPQVDEDNPAYVLVKARYHGELTPCYYKLDIVKQDPNTKLTTYLNLYRNFCYTLKITGVSDRGYDTKEEAMNNVASNNISSSVEVSEVTSIEDGKGHRLSVEDNDVMWVKNEPFYIGYEYLIPRDGGTEPVQPSDDVDIELVGDASPYMDIELDTANDRIIITPKGTLPETLERQDFILYTTDGSGLSRRITVRLRQPFEFEWIGCREAIPLGVNEEQVVGVRLPEQMPVSAFPMVLNIEPVDKTIYPDASRNSLPVQTHENSSFDYMATITFNDYRQSRSFYFYFLTNQRESATTINVTSDLFAEYSPMPSFINDDNAVSNSFQNLTLTCQGKSVGFNGNETPEGYVPFVTGTEVVMSFDSEEALADVVNIYLDYLEWVPDSRNTGTCVANEGNRGYTYTPNENTTHHVLVFRTKSEIVGEIIELRSVFDMATIEYRNKPIELTMRYSVDVALIGNRQGNIDGSINIIVDGETVTTLTADNGRMTMRTFVPYDMDTEVTFRATVRPALTSHNVSLTMTVRDIINSDGGTLTLTE